MQQQNSGMSCQLGSWALAAGVGLLIAILLLVVGSTSWFGSIFLGGVAFVVLGLMFNFLFCRELPPARGPGNIDSTGAASHTASVPKADATSAPSPSAPAAEATPAPAASEPAAPEPEVEETPSTAAAPEPTAAQPAINPSATLPGQDELAARKGEWKYEGGKAAAPAAEIAETPDYDGDGVREGTGEGSKPEMLSEAREGGPDNLKEIKGIGPKLEKMLNTMGFFHFDQIAGWSADEVAWVNANLEGFKGRVTRDDWVEQARILADGGETEFSKRVDGGDVY